MKGSTIIIAFLICGLTSPAQELCEDVIFPMHNTDTIINCCILSIEYGNVVHYRKMSHNYKIPARAVIKDGKYSELSLDKEELIYNDLPSKENLSGNELDEYAFYKKKIEGATIQRNVGAYLIFFGLGFQLGGIIMWNASDDQDTREIGKQLIYAGAAFQFFGFPLWISGGIKRKNNIKALNELCDEATLSLVSTGNSIGLRLTF